MAEAHIDELEGSDWEVEVSFADNADNRADPVIVRNKKTGGRIGIVYQKANDSLPRAQIISEIILNWLPTVLLASFCGDASGDGRITPFDAALILRVVVGTLQLNDPVYPTLTFERTDVNRDGIVSAIDAAMVFQYSAGLITKFPCQLSAEAPALNPRTKPGIAGTKGPLGPKASRKVRENHVRY